MGALSGLLVSAIVPLMLSLQLANSMADTSQAVTIVSVPFFDYVTPTGRVVTVSGIWFGVANALVGGVLGVGIWGVWRGIRGWIMKFLVVSTGPREIS